MAKKRGSLPYSLRPIARKGSHGRVAVLYQGHQRKYDSLGPQNSKTSNQKGSREFHKFYATDDPKIAEHYARQKKDKHGRGYVHMLENSRDFHVDAIHNDRATRDYISFKNHQPIGGYWIKEHKDGRVTRHHKKPFVLGEHKKEMKVGGAAVATAAVVGGGIYAYKHRKQIKQRYNAFHASHMHHTQRKIR